MIELFLVFLTLFIIFGYITFLILCCYGGWKLSEWWSYRNYEEADWWKNDDIDSDNFEKELNKLDSVQARIEKHELDKSYIKEQHGK